MFVWLYTDDTTIISESAADLQKSLNAYSEYCKICKLTVNSSNTKILIFSSGRTTPYTLKYNDTDLKLVSDYKYLGILFSRSGSF